MRNLNGAKMSYLTQRDVDNFGPELLDVAQLAARHTMEPELQRLHDENQLLQDQLNVATKTAIDRELDAAVPNWRQINSDERFNRWLLLPDTYSGVIRDRLLKDAAAAGIAARVANFFRGYLAQAGAASTNTAVRSTSGSKPTYARSQITQMAAMRRRGEIGDKEWARWEHELIRAGREGRIQGALDLAGR